MRFVADTNTLVSAILKPLSIPAQALEVAREQGCICFSEKTLAEATEVLSRNKFDKYLPENKRMKQLQQIAKQADFISVEPLSVLACRNPKRQQIPGTCRSCLCLLHYYRRQRFVSITSIPQHSYSFSFRFFKYKFLINYLTFVRRMILHRLFDPAHGQQSEKLTEIIKFIAIFAAQFIGHLHMHRTPGL